MKVGTKQAPSERSEQYERLYTRMREVFARIPREEPLFTTDASGLYDLFLKKLPAGLKQEHNCNTCRHFVNHYGGLVMIDDTGRQIPVFWGPLVIRLADWELFAPAVAALDMRVQNARVTGVFYADLKMPELGHHVTGEWRHFAVNVGNREANWMTDNVDTAISASQAMAQKGQDFLTVKRALHEFPIATLTTALGILSTGDELYRGEKVLAPIDWLHTLAVEVGDLERPRISMAIRKQCTNKLWRAIARAPEGFCHPRASMAGSLLEDLQSKLPLAAVKSRFAEKMHPLKYQRPQAPPKAGQIDAAERELERYVRAGCFERRYALLDEVPKIWTPHTTRVVKRTNEVGVFSHLRDNPPPAARPYVDMSSPKSITFARFRDEVMPHAQKIEYQLLHGVRGPYAALVAPMNKNAPAIYAWDDGAGMAERNAFSHFTYVEGSLPIEWGYSSHTAWVEVLGIVLKPCMWRDESAFSQYPRGVFFVLNGICNTNRAPACVFPEDLLSYLKKHRSVIEAHSRSRVMNVPHGQLAAGILLQGQDFMPQIIRVTTPGVVKWYRLDRWC